MNRLALVAIGLTGLAGCAITAGRPAPPSSVPPSNGITILSDTTLPASAIWARDVRWASADSVYLGLSIDGTVELSLDPAKPALKEVIPAAAKPGGFWDANKLAVSPRYLVVSAVAHSLTWRRLDDPVRQEEAFDSVAALDVQNDRLAVLSARRDEQQRYAPDGAIAWIGSLDKHLADLKPFLYDVLGPGAPLKGRCPGALGAVRFLSDGTVVVVPGTQPGVNLYDPSGKLLRTWETGALGIDADCGSLTEQQAIHLSANSLARHTWLNQRRIVDALLPLPQGPGLVVRRVEQGRTRWDLKVLRHDGTVESQPIPIEGNGEYFFLAADIRAGKMVFLLHELLSRRLGRSLPVMPRLIVAQVPHST